MEVATKFLIGKLPGAGLLAQDIETIIAEQGFGELAISIHHARLAGEMNIVVVAAAAGGDQFSDRYGSSPS